MGKETENVEIKDLTLINSESFLNKVKHFFKYIFSFIKADNNILEVYESNVLEINENEVELDSIINDYIQDSVEKEKFYKNENFNYYNGIYSNLDEGNISILDVSPDEFSNIIKFKKTEYEIMKNK